jgi:uncharacterized protein YegP (UPF0339 family)
MLIKMGERFEIKLSTDNQYYFVLTAPNNEVIATSEMYTTKSNCKNGIDAVRRYARDAPVEDKTL